MTTDPGKAIGAERLLCPSGCLDFRALMLRAVVVGQLNQIVGDRFGDRLVSVQCAQFGENCAYVYVDRNLSDAKFCGDLLRRLPSGGTGEEDEACCVAGIEAAGLTADASA